MSDQLAVFVEVKRGDGSTERVRVGSATRDGDGFLLKLGEMYMAAAPARAAGASSGGGGGSGDTSGGVLPNYGRSKGMPVRGASMQDLEFYLNGAKRTLSDPGKARFHDKERQLMAQHTKYLFGAYEAGTLHIYGPVLAPEGAFGMAVLAAADEAEVRKLMDADPSVLSGMNRYEVYPMMVGALRGITPTS